MSIVVDLQEDVQEQVVIEPTRAQQLWQTVESFGPLIGFCAGIVVLGFVSMVVILSLIPLYIQTNDLIVHHPGSVPYLLTYTTSTTTLDSLSVASTSDLANSLMEKTGLSKITVNYARFSSSSSAKKRRQADSVQCATKSSTLTGDKLVISVTVGFPDGCNSSPCQRVFIVKVEKYLEILHNSFTIPITLGNGQKMNVTMSLCSFVQNSTESLCSSSACYSSTILSCTYQSNGQKCTAPTCSPACQNGGTCFATNQCACTSQWTGVTCGTGFTISSATCSPACQNGGTCFATNQCACTSEWTGVTCGTALCSPVCSNDGTCVSPNVCSCATGWCGSDCTKTLVLLTTTSETVNAIWNTTARGNAQPSTQGIDAGNFFQNEGPQNIFDQILTDKYTNFGACNEYHSSDSMTCGVNTGFYVTLSRGPSVLVSIQFQTGNDLPQRDPLTITIEGSNQSSNALLSGSSWYPIYTGPTGLDNDSGNRSTDGTTQYIPNNLISYASYRVLVTSQRGMNNAVQYGEVYLYGY